MDSNTVFIAMLQLIINNTTALDVALGVLLLFVLYKGSFAGNT